jgi:hypothetical protein
MRPCITSVSLEPPVSSRTCTPPAAAPPGTVGPFTHVALPGAGSDGPEEGVTGPVQQQQQGSSSSRKRCQMVSVCTAVQLVRSFHWRVSEKSSAMLLCPLRSTHRPRYALLLMQLQACQTVDNSPMCICPCSWSLAADVSLPSILPAAAAAAVAGESFTQVPLLGPGAVGVELGAGPVAANRQKIIRDI